MPPAESTAALQAAKLHVITLLSECRMYQAREVPLGNRAVEMLTALPERRGELVSKQVSMDRAWPDVVVKPADLKVHMSALRDGRDGPWFIVNVPRLATT